jgi:hypothetical protein
VQDYLQIDEDFSFDQIAQQVVDQITKEREDFSEHYQQVLHEKQILINQIENRPVINNQEQDTQTIGKHLIKTNLFAILLVPFLLRINKLESSRTRN